MNSIKVEVRGKSEDEEPNIFKRGKNTGLAFNERALCVDSTLQGRCKLVQSFKSYELIFGCLTNFIK